jgi:hypothetical protein
MQPTRYVALRGVVVPVLSALLLLLGAPLAHAQVPTPSTAAPTGTSSGTTTGDRPSSERTSGDAPSGATDAEHATLTVSTVHRSSQPPRPDRAPLALVPLRVEPPVTSSPTPPVGSGEPGVADRHRSTADGRAPPA